MKSIVHIAVLLVALGGARVAAADDTPASATFEKHCASCHGSDGRGQTKMGKADHVKDWTDGKTLAALSDAKLVKMIKKGKGDMKSYAKLGMPTIKALVAYVRTLQR